MTREREEHFRLMREGFSHKQACRIVGINPVTGRRWRLDCKASAKTLGARPVPESRGLAISPRYPSQEECIRTADLLRESALIRSIAAQLGRSPTMISREIRRNRDPEGGVYRPHTAQALSVSRRRRPKTAKIAADPAMRERIQQLLDLW